MRLLRLSIAFLVGACASYDPARAPTESTTGRDFALRSADLPMDNVAKVADGVWRGAAPDAAGLRALKAQGFKTVVDLRTDRSYKAEAEALGLDVVQIPIHAHIGCDAPTDAQTRQFLDVVSDPARQPVYFHCQYGKDRTGTMCALYRREVCGWTCDESIEEMQAFGYHDWYRDLIGYVRDYEVPVRTAPAEVAPR